MFHLVNPAAEAAVRAVIHEAAAGRASWDDVSEGVALVSTLYPEILAPAAVRAIVDLYEDVTIEVAA